MRQTILCTLRGGSQGIYGVSRAAGPGAFPTPGGPTELVFTSGGRLRVESLVVREEYPST